MDVVNVGVRDVSSSFSIALSGSKGIVGSETEVGIFGSGAVGGGKLGCAISCNWICLMGEGDLALLAKEGFLRGGGSGENASSGFTGLRVLGVLLEYVGVGESIPSSE